MQWTIDELKCEQTALAGLEEYLNELQELDVRAAISGQPVKINELTIGCASSSNRNTFVHPQIRRMHPPPDFKRKQELAGGITPEEYLLHSLMLWALTKVSD